MASKKLHNDLIKSSEKIADSTIKHIHAQNPNSLNKILTSSDPYKKTFDCLYSDKTSQLLDKVQKKGGQSSF